MRKRFMATFIHPQVPHVRDRVDSDSICIVLAWSVSWLLRAFNARAHASIYIYIYIYICVCMYICAYDMYDIYIYIYVYVYMYIFF